MDSSGEPQDDPRAVRARPVLKRETSDIPMLDMSQLEMTAGSGQTGNQSATGDSQLIDHLRSSGGSPTGTEIARGPD